jgi:HAD superfamily hydrolase (TIGR01509 family)
MPALLFGSISTVADTSELQRQAFNEAFAEHRLDWRWDREQYRDMLRGNGGEDRIAAFARERGEPVDAAAVHRSKSERFRRLLVEQGVPTRPGVADTIRAARSAGWSIGLVTTTAPENVHALLGAVEPDIAAADLAVVVDRAQVTNPKPDPEAYRHALDVLGMPADECVAVEDNSGGVTSATAAGIACVAFPNENTAGHDFGSARRVTTVEFRDLDRALSASG